jgi:hypothetical protein
MTKYTLAPEFERIHSWVRDWVSDVADYNYDGSWGCHKVEDIENEHVSGFIPFTEGGAEIVLNADLASCMSSGSAPSMIQPFIDSEQKDCEEAWNEANPEHTVEWLYAETPPQADLLDHQAVEKEREHWKEKFWDFERDYFTEGGTFFYKVRAIYYLPDNSSNDSGEPEVLFMVGVNTDFEYGRDYIGWLSCYGSDPQQTHWVWEALVKAKDVHPNLLEQMAKCATDALASA